MLPLKPPHDSNGLDTEGEHTMVRRMIYDFIARAEVIKVTAMSKNKIWGNTTEILAAADMFHVNV